MKKFLIILGTALMVVVMICDAYIGDYYRCDDDVAAVASDNVVKISKTEDGWLYDGPGSESALIFYPGAKVQAESYAGIMRQLAAGGVDCFLVKMPGNLAFTGMSKADKIESEYSYDKWYLGGHSLGGAMAAAFAEKNSDKIDGLIFFAAYSANDLTKCEFPVLSIYGSNDKVLSMEKVEEGRGLVPEMYDEVVIEGGNHAGFGNYGAQKGDGEATISPEEQQAKASSLIIDFVETFS